MMQEGKPLAVVCLSLRGTKLQVGALTRSGAFISAPEVLWRSKPSATRLGCAHDH
jgi:hypothetical protein